MATKEEILKSLLDIYNLAREYTDGEETIFQKPILDEAERILCEENDGEMPQGEIIHLES